MPPVSLLEVVAAKVGVGLAVGVIAAGVIIVLAAGVGVGLVVAVDVSRAHSPLVNAVIPSHFAKQ